jgi:hypothetical protein
MPNYYLKLREWKGIHHRVDERKISARNIRLAKAQARAIIEGRKREIKLKVTGHLIKEGETEVLYSFN